MLGILLTAAFSTGILIGSLVTASSFNGMLPTTGQMNQINNDKVYTLYVSVPGNFTATGFAVKADNGVYLTTAGHVCATKGQSLIYASDDKPLNFYIAEPKNFKIYKSHDLCVIAKLEQDAPAFTVTSEVDTAVNYYAMGHPNGYPLVTTQGNILGIVNAEIPTPHIPIQLCVAPRYSIGVVKDEHGALQSVCLFKGPFYVTSIPATYGSSGSPVINSNSELVGVVSTADHESPSNWAGVVPLEEIRHFLKNIK